MDIKKLNNTSHPLSEKVVENGEFPFKLWLEFEETSPWENLENDFANISVDTLDGRRYGLNVWTYTFLNTAIEEDLKNGKGNYLIPPDLFVKELTRDCIEETLKELLNRGNLEQLLNESIFGLNFLEPYLDEIDMEEQSIQSLLKEFQLELSEHHVLFNKPVELMASKTSNDDIILKFEDTKIAVVHLTWKSKKEITGYPITRIYLDKKEFWQKEMRKDILEHKE